MMYSKNIATDARSPLGIYCTERFYNARDVKETKETGMRVDRMALKLVMHFVCDNRCL